VGTTASGAVLWLLCFKDVLTMARRRMISAELISDPEYNSLSMEAQNIFIRMLSISDDCGVVPANTYRLNTLINTPPKQKEKIQQFVDEIVSVGLGNRFTYRNENYFAFKAKSFEDYQSYILKKATKSEYLRIPKEEFQELSKNFQELPRISFQDDKSAVSTVESKEQKAKSRKQKAESKEQEKDTYGHFQNVRLTKDQYNKLLDKLGQEKLDKGIELLGGYKESKDVKYKSDYATFFTWVIEKLNNGESNGKNTGNIKPISTATATIGKYAEAAKRREERAVSQTN
jgi:hypothetical protein